jgi:lysophospholipase L1-like esterase
VVEGLSRIFFDPIDFLKPKTVSDEVLRYRIKPNSGAHDSWGFRNKSDPDTADIVAVGDSHTYGISATASNSWPNILQRITNKKVYNLSLGGYGPAEYLYLIEEKALKLDPELIIVGFYLGNDLKDSFSAVYSVPIWEDLRNAQIASVLEEDKDDNKTNNISDWLAGNSVLYRIVSSSFIGDSLRHSRRIKKGEDVLMLDVEDYGIHTGFTPDIRLEGLDLSDPKVREGLRLTLEFFKKMNQIAQEKEIDFLVVIIPTKESVFSEFIVTSDQLGNSDKLKSLIGSEEVVNKLIKAYFTENNIPYVDVLEPLGEAAGREQIYPNNFGGHTNKNGYRIIAESINKYLESDNSQ